VPQVQWTGGLCSIVAERKSLNPKESVTMEKKILVVDNNPMILEFLNDMLRQDGHEVLTAEDGLSALGILKTFTPDIMFVDLIMPNIEGEKLCQIVRGMPELKNVYLVILSAIAVEEEIDLAKLGANAHIAKGPFAVMRRHILDILQKASKESVTEIEAVIRGLEGIFPREITKELLATKRHFEIVLGRMREGIVEITSEKRIVYANPTALSLIGIAEEKLLGMRLPDLFSGSDRQRVEGLLDKMGPEPQTTKEEPPLSLNSRVISLTIITFNVGANKGLLMIHDETERKRLEGRLLKAQKMEAVATLAGGIAHDFNNILMAIVGNISLAKMHTEPGDKIHDCLTDAEKACVRAKELIQRFIAFSIGEKPVKKVGSISELLTNSVTLTLSGSNARCDFSIPNDLWQIEFDEGQLLRVFNSLVTNAKEAMPAGGIIEVGVENRVIGEDAVRSGLPLKPGKYVRISIQDYGKGIPKEHLPKIFDPYFSTKERGATKGMGLGLSIAYSIVKEHGGYIEAESEEGSGTIMFIYIPVSQKEILDLDKTDETLHQHKGKILLMDDEAMVRDVAGKLLNQLGYEVVFAQDGTEAIESYEKTKKSAEPFDAVILDLTVPGAMGGIETMERLLHFDPAVKGVVSSGYTADPAVTDCEHYGFSGAITKPYTATELDRTLRKILR